MHFNKAMNKTIDSDRIPWWTNVELLQAVLNEQRRDNNQDNSVNPTCGYCLEEYLFVVVTIIEWHIRTTILRVLVWNYVMNLSNCYVVQQVRTINITED